MGYYKPTILDTPIYGNPHFTIIVENFLPAPCAAAQAMSALRRAQRPRQLLALLDDMPRHQVMPNEISASTPCVSGSKMGNRYTKNVSFTGNYLGFEWI